MSRKAINLFFIIGSCLYIPGIVMVIIGYAIFLQNVMQNAGSSNASGVSPNGLGLFVVLLFGGMIMLSMGGIAVLVARIGALMEIAKAQEWVWFVLLIIFGWLVLLIYLLVGSKLKLAPQNVAYPYVTPGQPWANYQQNSGMMPPPTQQWQGYQQDMPNRPQD